MARYDPRYDGGPATRFTQPDTIVPDPGNPQDLNRYTYVRNNPSRYNDPTGRCIPGTASQELADACNAFFGGETEHVSRFEAGALASTDSDVFDYYWASVVQQSVAEATGGCARGDLLCVPSYANSLEQRAADEWDARLAAVEQCKLTTGCQTALDWQCVQVVCETFAQVLANGVNFVAPTVGFIASGVCVIGGGPATPVGTAGCAVALTTDIVVASNGLAAANCNEEGCAAGHLENAAIGGVGLALGRPAGEGYRIAAWVYDGAFAGRSWGGGE